MKYLRNIHEKKFWSHEISTRKNFELTRYPREEILDPQNTQEKKIRTHEGTVTPWHETHGTQDGTRPTEFSTLLKSTCVSYLISN